MTTFADRVVAWFDPVAAVRREQARSALAVFGATNSYHGADRSRRANRNWRPFGSSPDSAVLPALYDLRANSRDLVRNNPLAGGAIASTTSAVVGTGLTVAPSPIPGITGLDEEAAHEWGEQAKVLFELWAASPAWSDLHGRLSFYGLQGLAFRSALESGDVLALLTAERYAGDPFDLKLQLVEADRIASPGVNQLDGEWAGGIRVDPNGRPVSAFVLDKHPGGAQPACGAGQEVPFRGATGRLNALHLFTVLRPGQRRGVPYLAPVMEPLKQLGTYTDAEIMAAVVSGMFTVFVTKPGVDALPSTPNTSTAPAVAAGQQSGAEVGLDSGAIVDLAEGETVSFANPGRPNTAFDPFVQAILAQIGVGLELPVEVLTKRFLSSYSAARAALLDAWRFYRGRREWLATHFCQPIWESFLEEQVLAGRLRAPGFLRDPLVRAAYCRAVWIGDGPGAIDPLKEAEAAGKRIEIGISDRNAETIAYSGRNWDEVHAQLAREQEAMVEDGLCAPMAAPAAAPAAMPAADPEDPADAEDPADPKDATDPLEPAND